MNIAIFSLVLYFVFIIVSKLISKKILEYSKIIKNKSTEINIRDSKEIKKRTTLKISMPIAIILCFIPIVNICLDILICIFFYFELLALVAIKNTLSNL